MRASCSETLHSLWLWYKWVPHVCLRTWVTHLHHILRAMQCLRTWVTHLYHSQGLCSVSEHEALIYITAKGYAVFLNMRPSFISQLKGYMQWHSPVLWYKWVTHVLRHCIALRMWCKWVTHVLRHCIAIRMWYRWVPHVQRHCIALKMWYRWVPHVQRHCIALRKWCIWVPHVQRHCIALRIWYKWVPHVQRHCIALGCDVNECLMFRDTAYPLAVI
jgi:hypothetical protein